jgi:hypothetical protein
MEVSVRVWNGRKEIVIYGELKPFPELESAKTSKENLDRLDRIHQYHTSLLAEEPIYNNVQLFHSGRKWWLFYSPNRLTGGFTTKKKAMDWFIKGGR